MLTSLAPQGHILTNSTMSNPDSFRKTIEQAKTARVTKVEEIVRNNQINLLNVSQSEIMNLKLQSGNNKTTRLECKSEMSLLPPRGSNFQK